MPRVPVPEYQRQVQPGGASGGPRMSATPEPDFIGGALRQAAGGLADTQEALVAYRQKFQKQNDETAVNDLYANKFSPAFRTLYSAYRNTQGKDAVDGFSDFEKAANDLRTQYRDSLENDNQKKLFDSMSRGRVGGELDYAALHASNQRKAWMAQTHDATLGNIALQAADNYTDPKAFDLALRSADAEIERFGQASGESAATMGEKSQKFRSLAWKQRVQRAATFDPLGAADMYRANIDQFAPADRPVLEHALKQVTAPIEARLAVDRIMTGQKLDDLERAIDTGDKSFLKVAMQASQADQPMPTNVRDTRAMMPAWLSQIEGYAEKRYPGDPLMKDMMVNVAKGRLATITQAQEAIQRQAQGDLIDRIVQRKPASIDELLAQPGARDSWAKLDPQTQLGIVHLAGRGDGDKVRTDPKVMQSVFDRIHADDGDPQKITSQTELAQFMGHGLNFNDYTRLKAELAQAQTPEGNAFLKDVQRARGAMHSILGRSLMGQIQPDVAAEAAYRASMDLDAKIDQYRKEKKDPRTLITPGTPDYVLAPERLQTFMPTGTSAVAAAAAKKEAASLPKVSSDDDYAKVKPGAEFFDPNGVRRRKPL